MKKSEPGLRPASVFCQPSHPHQNAGAAFAACWIDMFCLGSLGSAGLKICDSNGPRLARLPSGSPYGIALSACCVIPESFLVSLSLD